MDWYVIVITAGAVFTAITAVWQKGIVPGYRGVRTFLATVRGAAQLIEAQLQANGGHSLLDRVTRIETQTRDTDARVGRIETRLDHMDGRLADGDARFDRLEGERGSPSA